MNYKYLRTSTLDAIIFDNEYTTDDIWNDYECHPQGWSSILKGERTIEELTAEEQESFEAELSDYID